MTDEDEKKRKQKERLERVKGLLEAKKKKEMEEKDYVKKSEEEEEKNGRGDVRGIGANPSFLAPRGGNNNMNNKRSFGERFGGGGGGRKGDDSVAAGLRVGKTGGNGAMNIKEEEGEQKSDDDIDPLDAFMTKEINPEIAEKERAERRRVEREREERANMDEGKQRKMLKALVNDSDDDDDDDDANNENMNSKPNEIIYIPTNKVKLFVGASGENVKRMQKSSNCRAQIRKKAKAMYEGFSGQKVVLINGDESDENEKDDAKTCVELYGDNEAVRTFKLLLEDLFARAKKMKTESRKQDRDRQKEKRMREKRLFHLRHAADYERLGVALGAPRKEIEKAYRKLMLALHPDKHRSKPTDDCERIQRQYDDMRASYDKLLAVDEENIQETKVLGKKSHEDELESLVPEEEKRMDELKRKVEEAKAKALSSTAATKTRFTTTS